MGSFGWLGRQAQMIWATLGQRVRGWIEQKLFIFFTLDNGMHANVNLVELGFTSITLTSLWLKRC